MKKFREISHQILYTGKIRYCYIWKQMGLRCIWSINHILWKWGKLLCINSWFKISFRIYFTKIIFGGIAFLFNNSTTGHFSINFFLRYPSVFFELLYIFWINLLSILISSIKTNSAEFSPWEKQWWRILFFKIRHVLKKFAK